MARKLISDVSCFGFVAFLLVSVASAQMPGPHRSAANPTDLSLRDFGASLSKASRFASGQHVPVNRLGRRSRAASQDASNPLFLPPAIYGMTQNASSVAIGDLNGDGILDLAATGNATVDILLGDGDGSFRPGSEIIGQFFASSVAIADVNGDGKPDLVITSLNTLGTAAGSVVVMLGNGDGTFQPGVAYDTGGLEARDVAVADLNSDGHPDLVAINCGSSNDPTPCFTGGTVGILLGRGDGTFLPAAVYGSGGVDGSSVALADLNGDGKVDVVVTNGCLDSHCATGGSVAVLLGNGNGTFQPQAVYDTGGASWSVAVVDLNADGKSDLAVANLGGTVSVLLGDGTGSFRIPVNYPAGVYNISLAAADVNGDGKPDLLLTDYDLGLDVLLGNGDGTFQSAVKYASGGTGALSVAVADLNGDGRADAVEANQKCIPEKQKSCVGGVIGVLLNDDGPHSPTATSLVSSADPAAKNQFVTYTATVTTNGSGAVGGTITFEDGGKKIAVVRVTDRQATYSAEYGVLGTHAITALYSGDTANTSSSSPTLMEYIRTLPVTSTTVLTTSGSPSLVGQSVTFTATVNSKFGAIPDGELVAFFDGKTLLNAVPLTNGVAAYATSSLSARTHYLKAKYAGDPTFNPSAGPVQQIVHKYSTTTALRSSLNPSAHGQTVIFTAKVTSAGPAPTGRVVFKDGTLRIGSATLSRGVAKLTKSTLAVGTHAITAEYLGDADSANSTSSVLNQVVQ